LKEIRGKGNFYGIERETDAKVAVPRSKPLLGPEGVPGQAENDRRERGRKHLYARGAGRGGEVPNDASNPQEERRRETGGRKAVWTTLGDTKCLTNIRYRCWHSCGVGRRGENGPEHDEGGECRSLAGRGE